MWRTELGLKRGGGGAISNIGAALVQLVVVTKRVRQEWMSASELTYIYILTLVTARRFLEMTSYVFIIALSDDLKRANCPIRALHGVLFNFYRIPVHSCLGLLPTLFLVMTTSRTYKPL